VRASVFFVIGSLNSGGAERHLLQILPRISARGYAVTVLTLGAKGSLAPHLEAEGIAVIEPGLSWLWRRLPNGMRRFVLLPLSMFSLLKTFISSKPDIVHFFLPQAYLMGGLASLFAGSMRRVMSRRSLNTYQQKHKLLTRLERKLHNCMDFVLGNSLAVTNQLLLEGVEKSRVRLIYNGVENRHEIDQVQRAKTRRLLGISPGCMVLICVANLFPYKGHQDLIQALTGVHTQLGGDWKLLLVGRDAGIWTGLRELLVESGLSNHVAWLGSRDDVSVLYAASDIGILCSHEEGFSNSVLEGMASGIPMVVTNVGGNAEAVIDQESGIVVPSHAPGDLGQAILSLALDESLRLRMGRAARERVATLFTVPVCVDAYVSLYDELMRSAEVRH
jgi:glycosyltransferase involved in cell wall biosynthesis